METELTDEKRTNDSVSIAKVDGLRGTDLYLNFFEGNA
jgi:hypothetical protein